MTKLANVNFKRSNMSKEKWFDVIVTFSDNHSIKDAVLAENEKQALQVAYWNWEYAADIKVT